MKKYIIIQIIIIITGIAFLRQGTVQAESSIEYIYVDIKGEVEIPGVYQVSDTTRLFQLIQTAGGLTSNAYTENINLAVKLLDEQMVVIPNEKKINTDLININSATLEQLDSLPGIGEKIASDIISYRDSIGGFSRIEDLINVGGIGNAILEKIKPFITLQ